MEIMKKSTKKFKEVKNCNQKTIKKTKEGGITLIALIVTIIILLILAGITIATLTGENGIITNAIQARNEYADGAVAEGFSLLWNEYQIEIRVPTGDNTKGIAEGTKVASTEDVKIQGDIKEYLATTETSFWDFLIGKNVINDNGVVNIENLIGGTLSRGNGTEETGDIYQLEESSGTYIVKYHEESSDEGYAIWQVSTTGESAGETIDWDKIFAEAKPAEGQSESNTAIGIGPRGEPVNMDYWTSIKSDDEMSYELRGEFVCSSFISAYTYEFTENGEIIGEIPRYIKKEDDDTFLPVTSLENAFGDCKDLKIAPEIPKTVINMEGTFNGCTSLLTAPEIPEGVTNMDSTFEGCTSLITAPEIPSSVTYMGSTFFRCTSLTTAPEIPESVTNMSSTFSGCTSLTTAPEIPESVTNMRSTFSGCTSLTTAPEIPEGVTGMSSAFSGCTSLTNISEIPSTVTGMTDAFINCTNLQGEIRIKIPDLSYLFCYDCFLNAATSGETLTLVGSNEEILNELKNTGSENSNIEIRVENE